MTEFVKVPKSELEKLEEARLRLYETCEGSFGSYKLVPITEVMWKLSHRKWDEVDSRLELIGKITMLHIATNEALELESSALANSNNLFFEAIKVASLEDLNMMLTVSTTLYELATGESAQHINE